MRGRVYYSVWLKALAMGLSAFSLFVVYAALHAREDQKLIAAAVAVFFVLGSLYLLYQAFFVFFEYDDEGLLYGVKRRRITWDRLVEKGYSELRQQNYLTFDGFGTIWLTTYMNGMEELGDFLEKKTRVPGN